MHFFPFGNVKNSNESEVSMHKEEAMVGVLEENKDKQQACCRLTGEAGSASWMKLMADSDPATQLALSISSGQERIKSKNLLRQQSSFGSAIPVLLRAAGSAVTEKQYSGVTAQLTIFYDGMVNVYDDVSPNKAHAIMLLASSGNTGSSRSGSALEKSISLAIYNQSTRKETYLPIARKQSLQRFLEKRQERRDAKACHAKEENVKPSLNPHPASSLSSLQ